MKLTNFFLPLQKEIPHEAEIISHQLMLKSGMIDKQFSGSYSFLPLGLMVLQNISNIIREEHSHIACNEILMPILQSGDLWQESGRYGDYGKEMLKVKDRHDRDMVFGPTNEEIVTDIFRKYVKSYKALPLHLYHIQWKFRDEIRPRFGLMRAREFLMKDAYSFDIDAQAALESYKIYYQTYLKIFKRLGVTAIPVRAENGAIGGDLSHEFHILANTGESQIYAESALFENIDNQEFSYDKLRQYYSAADEMHDDTKAQGKELVSKRGIEVGHIFNFATKYSAAMDASVMNNQGKPVAVNMGSYGIGVSRVMAGIIESSHDDRGIIWPDAVAPFHVVINPLQLRNEGLFSKALEIYEKLRAQNVKVLLDDRDLSAGQKFAAHDLIGIPQQLIFGAKSFAEGKIEIKNRKSGEKEIVGIENIIEYLNNKN